MSRMINNLAFQVGGAAMDGSNLLTTWWQQFGVGHVHAVHSLHPKIAEQCFYSDTRVLDKQAVYKRFVSLFAKVGPSRTDLADLKRKLEQDNSGPCKRLRRGLLVMPHAMARHVIATMDLKSVQRKEAAFERRVTAKVPEMADEIFGAAAKNQQVSHRYLYDGRTRFHITWCLSAGQCSLLSLSFMITALIFT